MKHISRFLYSIVASVLLLSCPVVTFTGCGTTPYKITSVSYTTVDAAMTAWGDYVAKFHPGAAQEAKVKQAYLAWQSATLTVIDTARAGQTSTGATNQDKVNAAVSAAATALSGLVSVLSQFGINLKL